MPAQQLVLLPTEEPRHPVPLPPAITAEAVQCMADLLLQIATNAPVEGGVEEVADEVLR